MSCSLIACLVYVALRFKFFSFLCRFFFPFFLICLLIMYLAAGEAGVTLGATNDEAARGVEVVDGLVVHEVGRDDGVDNLLAQGLADLVVLDRVLVLGADHHRVHALRDARAVVQLVLDRHLLSRKRERERGKKKKKKKGGGGGGKKKGEGGEKGGGGV